MPDTSPEPRHVVPHYRDPIRIVPLHLPEELIRHLEPAAAATPQLTYRGGPLLTAVKVFTVFWGAGMGQAQAALANDLNRFFTDILTSPLLDAMAEYSTPGAQNRPRLPDRHDYSHESRRRRSPSATRRFAICCSTTSPLTRASRSRTQIRSTSCTRRRVPSLCRVEAAPARRSAAITTTSAADYFMPRCPTLAVRAAPVDSPSRTRSHRRHLTSSAKRSPTPSPVKAGTTTRTAKSAISAPGKPKRSVSGPFSSNGPTSKASAPSADVSTHLSLGGGRPISASVR